MNIYRNSVLLVLFLTLASVAQKPAPSDALQSNLRKHVEYLASDKLEGRKTGEAGATTAAGYVANQFAQFKLKPGIKTEKGKGSFLQPFPYVAGVTLGSNNLLRVIHADTHARQEMTAGIDWIPLGYSPNVHIAPSPLALAGYGISSTEPKYDDYADLDAANKLILVFDGTPDAGNPHSEFARFNVHAKANIAKEKGARALVIIASSDDLKSDRLASLNYDRMLGETAVPVVVISRAQAAKLLDVDASGLKEIEAWFASKKTRPKPNFKWPFTTTELKVDLVKKTVDAYNVIGILEGTDPILKNEAIVIGAHYDHLGRGGSGSLAPNSTDIHHGADDNASGTAAVLELARQFGSGPAMPAFNVRRSSNVPRSLPNNKRTIVFIAFGGEEEGLLGSKHYVNNPVWPLDKTVAMINLDMVGRLNEQNKLTVGGIGTATEWRSLVEEKNSRPSLNLTLGHRYNEDGQYVSVGGPKFEVFSLQLNEDGFGPSDHSSFYGKQIPVLFLFTGTHLDYHKPSDTSEKIGYLGLSFITRYVSAIARSIDENPTRPTYKVAQSSGNMTARATFNISLGTIPSYAETNDGLGLDGVRDGSPAGKAGLKAGDKIVKLAGKDVRNISDYMFAMSTMKAGEEYEVVVKRGTETLTLTIVPAAAARR